MSYQGLYDRNPQVQRWFPQGIEQFAQFVMQRAAQIPDGEEIPDGLPEDMAADIMANMNDGGGGADGFMLAATYTPGCFEEFVDLVVPELQRRGRFRTEYTGSTLRDNLLAY